MFIRIFEQFISRKDGENQYDVIPDLEVESTVKHPAKVLQAKQRFSVQSLNTQDFSHSAKNFTK